MGVRLKAVAVVQMKAFLVLLLCSVAIVTSAPGVGRGNVNVNVNVGGDDDSDDTRLGFLSFTRSEVGVIKKLIELKLWFLKLIAKFLDSTDDGVHVHIGTSSGHRGGGGEHEIHVNVKGEGREAPWR